MNLETKLQQHFAKLRAGADFDARVLSRIKALAQLTSEAAANPLARREAALAAYQLTRLRLSKERQGNMIWVAVFGVIAILVATTLVPLAGDWAQASARLLGRSVLPGLSFGNMMVLLPLAVWIAVRQPSAN